MVRKKKIPIIKEDIVEDDVSDGSTYTRSVQVSTLNTNVTVQSTDPKDSLSKIKKMVTELVDMYRKCN